jgi:hypothetical protein
MARYMTQKAAPTHSKPSKASGVAVQQATPAESIRPTNRMSKASWLTVWLTLGVLAVPVALAMIDISNSVPMATAPSLFPLWIGLGGASLIAIIWINFAIWATKKKSSRST